MDRTRMRNMWMIIRCCWFSISANIGRRLNTVEWNRNPFHRNRTKPLCGRLPPFLLRKKKRKKEAMRTKQLTKIGTSVFFAGCACCLFAHVVIISLLDESGKVHLLTFFPFFPPIVNTDPIQFLVHAHNNTLYTLRRACRGNRLFLFYSNFTQTI